MYFKAKEGNGAKPANPPASWEERAAPAGWSPEDSAWGTLSDVHLGTRPVQVLAPPHWRVQGQQLSSRLGCDGPGSQTWSCLPAGLTGSQGPCDLYLCTQYNWPLWVVIPDQEPYWTCPVYTRLVKQVGLLFYHFPSRLPPRSTWVSGSKRGIGFSHHNPGGLHRQDIGYRLITKACCSLLESGCVLKDGKGKNCQK